MFQLRMLRTKREFSIRAWGGGMPEIDLRAVEETTEEEEGGREMRRDVVESSGREWIPCGA